MKTHATRTLFRFLPLVFACTVALLAVLATSALAVGDEAASEKVAPVIGSAASGDALGDTATGDALGDVASGDAAAGGAVGAKVPLPAQGFLGEGLSAASLGSSTQDADGELLLAQGITSGDWTYSVETSTGKAYLMGYTGTDSVITLPVTLDGHTLTSIGYEAFKGNTTLTTVTIPGNYQVVGMEAFYGCANLATINLNEGLEIIGSEAFSSTAIASITIPQSVTAIREEAFSFNDNLESLTIPAGVRELGQAVPPQGVPYYDGNPATHCPKLTAFSVEAASTYFTAVDGVLYSKDMTALYGYPTGKTGTSFEVPSSVKRLANSAFYGTSLTEIALNSGLEYIGDWCFSGLGITSMTLPDTVTAVGNGIFDACPELQSVDTGDGLINVGYRFCIGCPKLTSVTLGSSVELLENWVFRECSALETLALPANVKTIGINAFYQCTNLTTVTGATGLKTISDYAFNQCSALTSLPLCDSLVFVSGTAFEGCEDYSPVYPSRLKENALGDWTYYVSPSIMGDTKYGLAYQVLDIVNTERAEAGLATLTMNEKLLDVAMRRAAETAVYFSHTRPNGERCESIVSKDVWGTTWGENIAAGTTTAAAVMNSWMNSAGHRENILEDSFQSVGIGCFVHNGIYYWTQFFADNSSEQATQPNDASNVEYTIELVPEQSNEFLSLWVNATGGQSLLEDEQGVFTLRNTNVGWWYSTAIFTNRALTWTSSDEDVFTVGANTGVVSGVRYGKADLTATIGSSEDNLAGSGEVTITGNATNRTIPLGGTSRYDTVSMQALYAYPPSEGGATGVIIAGGNAWPDALTATALAGALDYPILITAQNELSPQTAQAIEQLAHVEEALIVGGPGVVSDDVFTQLEGIIGQGKVHRLYGQTRYETAQAIYDYGADKTLWDGDMAIIATGSAAADALSISPLAAVKHAPILLAEGASGELSTASKERLAGQYATIIIAGGTGVVSSASEDWAKANVKGSGEVLRFAGVNRFATSLAIANACDARGWLGWDGVAFAYGLGEVDALGGSIVQGKDAAILLLVDDYLGLENVTELGKHTDVIETIKFFGGTGVVSQNVRNTAAFALGWMW